VSYYHFYKVHFGFRGTFPDFFDRFVRGKVEWGSWFDHVAGWYPHRGDPNVLFLTYEDLRHDLEGCIRQVADFCGFEVQPERFTTIMERCSFAFMKEHESKFDPVTGRLWEQGVEQMDFIRKGQLGEWVEYFSREQEARFEKEFKKWLGKSGLSFTSDQPSG